MKIGEKEITWELLSQIQFMEISQKAIRDSTLKKYGIRFPSVDLKLNVSYDNPEFKPLLREKFELRDPYSGVPHLTFIRNCSCLGFKLHYKHYGYMSDTLNKALVFASSFGMFKSTISGYASLFMDPSGYVPAHASVLSANGKGLLFAGGSAAGKTTTLINLVDWLLLSGESVNVLTDDWAIVARSNNGYFAKSFDSSISLRQNNLDENQHIRFHCHNDVQRAVATQKKVSRSPEDLYGHQIGADRIDISAVVLLLPEEGTGKLCPVNVDEFAKKMINMAYHYPYVKTNQMDRHKSFWIELAHKLPVLSFSTRGFKCPSKSIDALKELIHDK